MRIAGIVTAVVVSTAALHGQARADVSRALTAAKAGLPADAKVLVGVDFAAIQKTQLFATYYPKLHDKPDAAKVIDALKDGCKLDPVAIVQGLVVAAASDGEDGAMYVAVQGVDKTKLASCLQAAKSDDKSAKVEVKNAGNITEVTKGGDTAFFGWIGKDVVVVPFHANDKASLTKWMGGKGTLAKSELGKTLAKVNTAAAIWGAAAAAKEIQPGMTARGGYGTVSYANGSVAADVHAMMESVAQASSMATSANQQLDEVKKGQLPPEFTALLKAVTIAADQDEVWIKANVAEKDLMGAIASAMAIFGGP